MNYTGAQGALQYYRKVGVQAGITDATPHRLVQMLLEGAMEKISTAKGLMSHGMLAEKGRMVSWAISIIGGLRASLNLDEGGEIARNLDALYDYMERRLLDANLHNDAAILDEVLNLLREIKQGWDAIPESYKSGRRQAVGA